VQEGETRNAGASAEPVFVLCAGRSGSTLLRFLLDAHPDLACPPETNVPALCGQLATVWSLIEGAPLSANRGDEPPVIPEAAIAGVRETVDRMVGSYLARRGKKRYCDKSLGTARFAYLMQRVWPEAKFLCLYRHPMDVIVSGIEACPWGLNGYGFDAYIAESPGNAVFALARFWADNAATILAAEEQYPDRCHRIRYEDLVTDPEDTAAKIFTFLGVPQVPGISQSCFAETRERFGPADYKIWHTSRITADSVGRGWTIPAGLIPPPARARINELAGVLGYVPVDESWGTADMPAELVVPAGEPSAGEPSGTGPVAGVPMAAGPMDGGTPAAGSLVAERLAAGLARIDDRFMRQWEPCARETFAVIATPRDRRGHLQWSVDLAARTVTAIEATEAGAASLGEGVPGNGVRDGAVTGGTAPGCPVAGTAVPVDGVPDGAAPRVGADESVRGDDDSDAGDWDVIGPVGVWDQVVRGEVNLSVVLRRYELRYCDYGDAGPVVAEARIGMLADLLGLTGWGRPRDTAPASETRDTVASAESAPSRAISPTVTPPVTAAP
jgi:hypothetical protein